MDVYDPWASTEEVKHEYGIDLVKEHPLQGTGGYDAVVLAVSHNEFKNMDLAKLRNGHNAVIYDIKGLWRKEMVDGTTLGGKLITRYEVKTNIPKAYPWQISYTRMQFIN